MRTAKRCALELLSVPSNHKRSRRISGDVDSPGGGQSTANSAETSVSNSDKSGDNEIHLPVFDPSRNTKDVSYLDLEESIEMHNYVGSIIVDAPLQDGPIMPNTKRAEESSQSEGAPGLKCSNFASPAVDQYLESGHKEIRVFVQGVCNDTDQRKWDKDDVCYYCKTRMRTTPLASHLETQHSEMEEVKEITLLPKRTILRKNKLQCLRNLGNFSHNINALKNGGEIITVQRPSQSFDISNCPDEFQACNDCLGFYQRTELWRHRCPKKELSANASSNKKKSTLPCLAIGSSTGMQQFLNRIRYDELGKIMINDDTIIKFLRSEIDSRGIRLFNTISSEGRLLAELLKYVNESTRKRFTLSSLLQPCNFDLLYDCFTKMFQYDAGEIDKDGIPKMSRPSTFRRLVQTLFKVNQVLKITYLTEMSKDKAEEQDILKTIMTARLQPLSTNAHKALKSASSGLPQELPRQGELLNFKAYLVSELKETKLSEKNRRRLSELLVARLIEFNKRRAGEVSKLTPKIWALRRKWKENALDSELSSDERNLVDKMELVYVPGKCHRYVPIIFPPETIEPTSWLCHGKNEDDFVFVNSSNMRLRGSDVITKIRKEGNFSSCLTSTQFRKAMATNLQTKDMSEAEYRWTCDHLGHSLEVHKRFYRLRDTAVSLSKVGKMLMDDEQ